MLIHKVKPMQLFEGDCLEIMKQIPDTSVDMVLCDLPYGTTKNKWDSILPLDKLWEQYKRICTGAVVLTAAQPFTSTLIMSNIDQFKYAWVWNKVNRNSGFLNAKKQPLRSTEDIPVFYSQQSIYNPQMITGKVPYKVKAGLKFSSNYGNQDRSSVVSESDGTQYPRNLIHIPADERGTVGRVHPTQKPVALMEYRIRTYTNEGAVVLDNCMGSGTTGVACANTNRDFIGIEQDPKYFQIAKSRIYEALAEFSFFGEKIN